ncbi:nuclear transport factor 2 family protein [Nocardiopsis alborubida]|uniref:Nuclear transport factor 2 family protein n=1 Tax=Nocardiopsis alborubida TaxID=146802 RepID=A0A7X6MCH2_9ACTN|nr:nuclear transport factor 2 family protein [Nocardiopsis alborubida]NKY97170.1 nuclear transport factor 2 family protein [Nocardiopsis alborubida]
MSDTEITEVSASVLTGLSGLPSRLVDTVNRSEIEDLISRHYLSPDERRVDDGWLTSVYTEDFVIVLPHGTYEGYDGMREALENASSIFEASHHLVSNHVIDLKGGSASIRSVLIATHLADAEAPAQAYTTGAIYRFEALYTADGWRLARAEFDGVWTAGEPPFETTNP